MFLEKKLSYLLFLLRASIFIVMLVWTIDKFARPAHASAVYEIFYSLPSFESTVSYIIGGVELVIILGFLLGAMKTWTYGAVLLFHSISTLSSYNEYLAPYTPPNILFFAAIPMLAACITLFALREYDNFLTVN